MNRVAFVVLLVGVLLILLAAFGVTAGTVSLFALGTGVSFASLLIDRLTP